LTVFAGGFTLESASAVTRGALPAVVDFPVANLVVRSLISADVNGPVVYYRLLETTRVYALEKLQESGELDTSWCNCFPATKAPSTTGPVCSTKHEAVQRLNVQMSENHHHQQ
jgi:predicted ATPase